jgi:TRAP-type C4-dicarboxylate transport system substrate-binding protein
VYSALQTGNIDGAEDNIVAYYAARHYEVAPYFTYDEHARIPEAIIGSRVTMLQLTKNDQAIIEQAARESAGLQRQKWLATEAEVFKALNARGLLILWGDYESRERFLSAAKPFYDSFGRAEFEALAE